MKRILLLAAALLASSSFTQSALAQMGGRNRTPMGETIDKKRAEILGQQKKYAKSPARSVAPARRDQPQGTRDAFGRLDLAGKPAPGYPSIRDGSLSASRYAPSRRSAPTRRSQASTARPRRSRR